MSEGPKIIATCPECGQQELSASGMHLTERSHGENHTYEFFCPVCFDEVVRPATDEVLAMLAKAGVRRSVVDVPLEMLEHNDTAPPLTIDDMMDFVVELRAFGQLVEPGIE